MFFQQQNGLSHVVLFDTENGPQHFDLIWLPRYKFSRSNVGVKVKGCWEGSGCSL